MPKGSSHAPTRNVIVVGGSAGGVEALIAVVAGLPADLPASVCVVLHRPAYLTSSLADILARAGPLPVRAASQGARLEPGVIYVAVSDHHLLIERAATSVPNAVRQRAAPATLRITRGPKENRARPAIDPLFRSAALAFGPRVIAVVLSGALDDGTGGLWAVRDLGGLAIIQDPGDAAVTSMPASALAEVGADYVARASEIGPLLGRLTSVPLDAAIVEETMAGTGDEELRREVAMAAMDDDVHEGRGRYGVPSRYGCPDCGGTLWDTSNGRGPMQFRCTIGHAYSVAGLAEAQNEHLEDGLWAAVRALEEKAELARVRASHALQRGLTDFAARYQAQVEATLAQAAALLSLLRMEMPRDTSQESRSGADDAKTASRPGSASSRGAESESEAISS